MHLGDVSNSRNGRAFSLVLITPFVLFMANAIGANGAYGDEPNHSGPDEKTAKTAPIHQQTVEEVSHRQL
jgi:hypothetical protein